jgi:hypothetical protein
MEDSIILDLEMAREHGLQDGCPRPAEPLKYLPQSSSFTGSIYTNSLVAKDKGLDKRSQGMFKDRTCPGLFAIKEHSSKKTYVIATTGEILLLNNRGEVELLRPH